MQRGAVLQSSTLPLLGTSRICVRVRYAEPGGFGGNVNCPGSLKLSHPLEISCIVVRACKPVAIRPTTSRTLPRNGALGFTVETLKQGHVRLQLPGLLWACTPQRSTLAPQGETRLRPPLIMHCSLMWGPADPCSRHGVRAKVKWHIAWRTTVFSTMPALPDCLPAPTGACMPAFSL